MWTLNRPSYTARDAFAVCVSRVRDRDLKQRLEAAMAFIEEASDEYAAAALTASLHEILASDLVGTNVTRDEMVCVYTDRMAKKGAPGRYIYDDIFAAPAQGKCPLCGQRAVETLDHHLPKARYPALAVAPLNLVPACYMCNKAKHEAPGEATEVCLHPYFDVIDDRRWLRAEVLKTRPAALRFSVEAPEEWDEVLRRRVTHHFQKLRLAELYASESAEELLNIRHQLEGILAAADETAVRAELASRAASALRAKRNGWRTAAYEAWSANSWFCSEGFAHKG